MMLKTALVVSGIRVLIFVGMVLAVAGIVSALRS